MGADISAAEIEAYTQAARRAVKAFPVEPEDIIFITRSENVTFRVPVQDQDHDYVLRLHRPGYSTLEELNSERSWTQAMRNAGLPVPDALGTHSGENYTLVDVAEAEAPGEVQQLYAGMTLWQEGIPLADYQDQHPREGWSPALFHRLGRLFARMHNQASAWEPPAGFVRRDLGLENLLGEQPFWGRFWDHPVLSDDEKSRLLSARSRLYGELEGFGKTPDNFSLIHSDMTLENIICKGAAEADGGLSIIDFDDAAFGWHLYDLASLLVECTHATDFDGLQTALLAGYQEHRPLGKRDIEFLPRFVLIRGLATLGWYLDRPEQLARDAFSEHRDWVNSVIG